MKKVELRAHGTRAYYDGPPFYEIDISTKAQAVISTTAGTTLVFLTSQGPTEKFKKYIYPASGYYYDTPRHYSVSIEINTSFLTPAQEYSVFHILIPREQTIVTASYTGDHFGLGEVGSVTDHVPLGELFIGTSPFELKVPIKLALNAHGYDVELYWPNQEVYNGN